MQNNSHPNAHPHFRPNSGPTSSFSPGDRTTLVNQIVESTVDSCKPQFEKSSIDIELDLENVEAEIDREMVRKTTKLLLDNATEKMFDGGGTISVTLIDGKHQWELEVADSKGMAYHPFGHSSSDRNIQKETLQENKDLPVIIQFPSTDALRLAYRTAAKHGGQIQTWDCPQGGTAHVLVVPKHPHRNKFSV